MNQSVELCSCGDRPIRECPGEWEAGCDLGANENHVVVVDPDLYAGNQVFDEWRGF